MKYERPFVRVRYWSPGLSAVPLQCPAGLGAPDGWAAVRVRSGSRAGIMRWRAITGIGVPKQPMGARHGHGREGRRLERRLPRPRRPANRDFPSPPHFNAVYRARRPTAFGDHTSSGRITKIAPDAATLEKCPRRTTERLRGLSASSKFVAAQQQRGPPTRAAEAGKRYEKSGLRRAPSASPFCRPDLWHAARGSA